MKPPQSLTAGRRYDKLIYVDRKGKHTMRVSQKCQYAVRAVLHLARYHGGDPVKIGEIADAQGIPERFLEVILSELKSSGFVSSRRGRKGGYMLNTSPHKLTLGQVIRFVDGPLTPVSGLDEPEPEPDFYGHWALRETWRQGRDALSAVYDEKTFAELLEDERAIRTRYVPQYAI